jgi:hypothetical protein
MPESLLAGTASLFYGLQQGRLGYSHRIACTIPQTERYLFTLRYTDECRPRKSRSCFITSTWGHETAAQAASLQQAHFMPASVADSQASEGYECALESSRQRRDS